MSCQYMFGGEPYSVAYRMSGMILAGIASIHMIPNLIQMVQTSKKMDNQTLYPALITETYFQNISGIIIIVFMCTHPIMVELGYAFTSPALNIIRFILDSGLYIVMSVHLFFGFSHMFISFGIITDRLCFKVLRYITAATMAVVCIILITACARYCLM